MAEYQFSKEKKGASSRTVKIVVVILLFIAFIIYATIGNFNIGSMFAAPGSEGYAFKETGSELKYDAFTNPIFYTYPNANGYYYVTKDGIKFITESGETKLNYMYNMVSPSLQGEGNIAAVAEQRGNAVYVFNEEGLLYEAQTINPIISFSINSKGQCSVITQKDDDYKISVFTNTGGLIHEHIHPANNVFPVNSDISNDGRFLAVLLYDITGVNVSSKITFHILNKKEAIDYANSVYGLNDDFLNETVYLLKFMNGNNLITISDKETACIDPESKCQKIWRFALNNRLDAAFFDNDIFVLAYGRGLVNKEAEQEGLVKIFKMDMTESASFLAKSSVTSLTGARSSFIIGSGGGRDFTAINSKGEELWHYNSIIDVKQILFLDTTDKILVAGETKAVIYKGEKVRIEQPQTSEPQPTDSTE